MTSISNTSYRLTITTYPEDNDYPVLFGYAQGSVAENVSLTCLKQQLIMAFVALICRCQHDQAITKVMIENFFFGFNMALQIRGIDFLPLDLQYLLQAIAAPKLTDKLDLPSELLEQGLDLYTQYVDPMYGCKDVI